MTSTNSQTTSSPNSLEEAIRLGLETPETYRQHLGHLRKLKHFAGLIAHEHMQDESDRQRRNLNSEEAAARKAAGWPDAAPEDDDMRTTILGDVTFTDGHKQGKPQPSQLLKWGMAALLAGTPIGAGLGAWKIAESLPSIIQSFQQQAPPQVIPQPADDHQPALRPGRP